MIGICFTQYLLFLSFFLHTYRRYSAAQTASRSRKHISTRKTRIFMEMLSLINSYEMVTFVQY